MALLLGVLPLVEQVELDSPHHAGDARLARLSGGEVAGLPGFPRAGARPGRPETKNPGMRILSRNVASA